MRRPKSCKMESLAYSSVAIVWWARPRWRSRTAAASWQPHFRQDGVPHKDRPRSLVNDVLIAITCRENGFTLLTTDEDFKMIRRHLRGFAHAPPWPADANPRRAIRAARVK